MARMVRMSGMSDVLKNIRKAGDKINKAIARGLVKGGVHLQKKSQEIVPVQTGNLKNTAFTRNVGGSGADADVVVGYTADYAVYVHEDLTKAHGLEFNIKHADKIAKHGEMRTRKGGSEYFHAFDKGGKAKGGWFPRGENQTAKFLEKPMREERSAIIRIVAKEARKVR